MLFTIEKLSQTDCLNGSLTNELVHQVLLDTEEMIYQKYTNKHQEIVDKLAVMRSQFNDRSVWWNKVSGLEQAKNNFTSYIDIM